MPRLYFDVTKNGNLELEIIVGDLCFSVESRNSRSVKTRLHPEPIEIYPAYFRAEISFKQNHITIRLGD